MLRHETTNPECEFLANQDICFRARAVLPLAVDGDSHPPLLSPSAPGSIQKVTDLAGYVKIWTTLANKEEFISASALFRGLYLQLIFWCKVMGDTGSICGRGWAGIGSVLGCDGKTCRKFLGNFQEKSFLTYTENSDGSITVNIPKYRHWQEIDVKGVVEKSRKNPEKSRLLDQTRPDHGPRRAKTDTENHHKKAVVYFCEIYEKAIGEKYDFKRAKDGNLVKRLLKTYGFEKFCVLVDQLFRSTDSFILSTDRGIGVLSACSNKLVQELALPDSPLAGLSLTGKATAANIAKVLKEYDDD